MIEFIKNEDHEVKILVSLEEYKDLLVTKGKYESIKNIKGTRNNNVLDKNIIIKFLKEQIKKCNDVQLQTINNKLKDYMSARKTKLAYTYLLQQIERGEFDAD